MNQPNLQLRSPLQTRQDEVIHPSLGVGNPYSQDMRNLVMFLGEHFNDVDNVAVRNMIDVLRQAHVYPSSRTQTRWEALHDDVGHVRPCRRSGNHFGERFAGQDLVFLALYRMIYPKSTHAEVNAFLYRCNLGNPRFQFYSPSQICRAETLIGLTRKKGSTTAYQALLPRNLIRRYQYWNYAFPIGIADINRSQIIDLDECGVFVETTASRRYGKAYKGFRVRETGAYTKGEKWNFLLAVCGENGNEEQNSRRWAETWLDGGTTVHRMLNFVQVILNDIGHANEQNFFVFTMDNLNSHKNEAVIALIHLYGHGVVYRAPYWPVDGAIEFIFNTIQTLVRARMYTVVTSNDLIASVYESVQSIDSFAQYFIHVGFVA